MDILQLILLGLIQGITEFLPISSSAHLILLPKLTGWQDQGLVNDIAAHVGSLVAVIIYFRSELSRLIRPWISSHGNSELDGDKRLLLFLIVSTVPIVLVGAIFYDDVSELLRNPVIIAIASIVFGLILWWADVLGRQQRKIQALTIKDAIVIGMAQVLALIPGTSRSGITMTAGLFMGLDRQAAARFSFLLAIPTITLAGGHEAYRYLLQGAQIDWFDFTIVALVSAISAWLSIHYFLKFLQRTGMFPYVIYRVALGLVLLYMFI